MIPSTSPVVANPLPSRLLALRLPRMVAEAKTVAEIALAKPTRRIPQKTTAMSCPTPPGVTHPERLTIDPYRA